MKGHVLHLSWLHGVIPSVWVVVGRSLDRANMFRMLSRLCAISGDSIKILQKTSE